MQTSQASQAELNLEEGRKEEEGALEFGLLVTTELPLTKPIRDPEVQHLLLLLG